MTRKLLSLSTLQPEAPQQGNLQSPIDRISVSAWVAVQGAYESGAREGGHCCATRQAHSTAQLWKLDESNGEDLNFIQELLRHATFKVTADTYTQAVTPVKREAQAKVARLILAEGIAEKPVTPTIQ